MIEELYPLSPLSLEFRRRGGGSVSNRFSITAERSADEVGYQDFFDGYGGPMGSISPVGADIHGAIIKAIASYDGGTVYVILPGRTYTKDFFTSITIEGVVYLTENSSFFTSSTYDITAWELSPAVLLSAGVTYEFSWT